MDNLCASLLSTSLALVVFLLILGALAAAAVGISRRAGPLFRIPLMLMAAAAALGLLTAIAGVDYWVEAGRPLPFLLLVLLLLLARPLCRFRATNTRHILHLTCVLFAFLMLARMVLNTRLYHFGFVLTIPALLVIVAFLCRVLPRRLEALFPGSGRLLLAGLALWISLFAGNWLYQTEVNYRPKTYLIGSGGDTFYAEQIGTYVQAVVTYVQTTTTPEQTVSVFPDSVLINYLARRRAPNRFIQFLPSEFDAYGELAILHAFQEHPPDVIVLTHRDTSGFGKRYFGDDYATDLARWLKLTFRVPGKLFGAMPFNSEDRFGLLALRRDPPLTRPRQEP